MLVSIDFVLLFLLVIAQFSWWFWLWCVLLTILRCCDIYCIWCFRLMLLIYTCYTFYKLFQHCISINRKHSKLNFQILFLKFVLKFNIITLLLLIILIFYFLSTLLPLLYNLIYCCTNIRFHSLTIKWITLGKFIYSKFNFNGFSIVYNKIVPLT